MLWLLPIMMVYAASVDSQDTMLSTVVRVSYKMLHVLLLAVRRVVKTIIPVVEVPGHLQ